MSDVESVMYLWQYIRESLAIQTIKYRQVYPYMWNAIIKSLKL